MIEFLDKEEEEERQEKERKEALDESEDEARLEKGEPASGSGGTVQPFGLCKPVDMSKSVEERLRAEAKSHRHMATHEPKNPFCEICTRARAQRRSKIKGSLRMGEKPKKFGDQITADHLVRQRTKLKKDPDTGETIVEDSDWMPKTAKFGVVMYDRATGWLSLYPTATKGKEDTVQAFQRGISCVGIGMKTSVLDVSSVGKLPQTIGNIMSVAAEEDLNVRRELSEDVQR